MPTVTQPLGETYNSITRPVALAVVRGLMDTMRLPNGGDVKFQGNINTLAQKETLLSQRDPNRTPVDFPFTQQTYIDVDEHIVDAETVTYASVRHNDARPIFHDPKLRIDILPIHTQYEVTVNIRYRAPNRTQAQRWLAELKEKAARGRQAMFFTASFHYEVPKAFQVILANLYQLREANAGYGESLREYLEQYLSSRATVVTTVAGGTKEVHIAERQVRIQGILDFIDVPDRPEADDQANAYTTGFSFTFQYTKPIAMKMVYPIVVHNQPMSMELIPTQTVTDEDFFVQELDELNDNLRGFEQQRNHQGHVVDAIIDPPFDDWQEDTQDPFLAPLYTTVALREDTDPHWAFTITTLEGWKLYPEIEAFMKDERQYMTVSRLSPFTVTLFEQDVPINGRYLKVDETLKVTTTFELDPRKLYHGRVSVIQHLGLLTDEALSRLRHYPAVMQRLVELLDQTGRMKDKLKVIGGKAVTKDSMKAIVDEAYRQNTDSRGRGVSPMKTVVQFRLIAHSVKG